LERVSVSPTKDVVYDTLLQTVSLFINIIDWLLLLLQSDQIHICNPVVDIDTLVTTVTVCVMSMSL